MTQLPPPKPEDPHVWKSVRRGGGVHWHGCSGDAQMECRFSMQAAETWLVSGAPDESW